MARSLMTAPATIASIRFGLGLGPGDAPPAGVAELLAGIQEPDTTAQRFPVASMAERLSAGVRFSELQRARRAGTDPSVQESFRRHRNLIAERAASDFRTMMLRLALAEDGFRERLVLFWADHFTATVLGPRLRGALYSYVDEAIRPHVAGRFADMLRAVVTHPVMLLYLDQARAMGPDSPLGRLRGRGLNENLAREVLELHTLGVGGVYGQADVRQLAELFTGLSLSPERGFHYRPRAAEPGTEEVLGRRYGGGAERLEHVLAVLDDLAVHPDTARHIARKLATHFVADAPDPGLVDHIAARYTESGGALPAVYDALLEHPAAWAPKAVKLRRPVEFLAAALRALAPDPAQITSLNLRETRVYLAAPLAAMGQPFEAPPGPDGWPEAAEDWISPPLLAARLQWAMTVPRALRPTLPDPRDFVQTALADAASPALVQAAARAETRWEGVGLILASPEFNRR